MGAGRINRLCLPCWSNTCRFFKIMDKGKMTSSMGQVGCFGIDPLFRDAI